MIPLHTITPAQTLVWVTFLGANNRPIERIPNGYGGLAHAMPMERSVPPPVETAWRSRWWPYPDGRVTHYYDAPPTLACGRRLRTASQNIRSSVAQTYQLTAWGENSTCPDCRRLNVHVWSELVRDDPWMIRRREENNAWTQPDPVSGL